MSTHRYVTLVSPWNAVSGITSIKFALRSLQGEMTLEALAAANQITVRNDCDM